MGAPILTQGKLHVEMLGEDFPSEGLEGAAAIFVSKIKVEILERGITAKTARTRATPGKTATTPRTCTKPPRTQDTHNFLMKNFYSIIKGGGWSGISYGEIYRNIGCQTTLKTRFHQK